MAGWWAACLALAVLSPTVTVGQVAAPPPEISYLLNFIATSNCQFYRNGNWYTSMQAEAHLDEKLALINASSRVRTAEDFIEKVATKSALTSRPYLVRCTSGDAVAVNEWLRQELKHHRQAH